VSGWSYRATFRVRIGSDTPTWSRIYDAPPAEAALLHEVETWGVPPELQGLALARVFWSTPDGAFPRVALVKIGGARAGEVTLRRVPTEHPPEEV